MEAGKGAPVLEFVMVEVVSVPAVVAAVVEVSSLLIGLVAAVMAGFNVYFLGS